MAQDLINQFYAVYPRLHAYTQEVLWQCQRDEYVQTWLLRKRRLISINSEDDAARSQAERQTLNSIIQGTASDVAMVAMNMVEYDPVMNEIGASLLMQIHDELIIQVPEQHRVVAEARLRFLMEEPFVGHFAVALSVTSDSALTWADAK